MHRWEGNSRMDLREIGLEASESGQRTVWMR